MSGATTPASGSASPPPPLPPPAKVMSSSDIKRIIRNYLWRVALASGGILTVLVSVSGYFINEFSFEHGLAEGHESAFHDETRYIADAEKQVGEAMGRIEVYRNEIETAILDSEDKKTKFEKERSDFSSAASQIISRLTDDLRKTDQLMQQENAAINGHYELLAQSLAKTITFRDRLASILSKSVESMQLDVNQLKAMEKIRVQVVTKQIRLDATNCEFVGGGTSICKVDVGSQALAGKTIVAAMLSQPTDAPGNAQTIFTLNGFDSVNGSIYVARPWQANWSPQSTDILWHWVGQLVIFYE
jgi:hypothetical protein